MFHFDISGNEIKDEHDKNILSIFSTFLVFHFDISGIDLNEEHAQNKQLISVILFIFQKTCKLYQ